MENNFIYKEIVGKLHYLISQRIYDGCNDVWKLTLFHEVSNSRWPPAVPYTDQGEPAAAAAAADPAAAAVPAAVPAVAAVPAAPVTVPPELEYVQKYNKFRKN